MLRGNLTRSTSLREPYRATKLWLEAVAIFRKGVPLAKHRNYFKSYDDCFVAQDAIGWFHKQLQQHFDNGISRKQALQLLQKFYKSGIFVSVSSRTSLADGIGEVMSPIMKETDFKDNGALYRLSGYTSDNNDTAKTLKTKKASPASRSHFSNASKEKLPSTSQLKYSVIINPLPLDQIYIIWRDVFIHRFVQIVGCEAFQAFANVDIRGDNIRHNLTRTESYGAVLVPNPAENVPVWLITAMKTLATWPNSRTSSEVCHVNYPGFENDVFKLITDYFTSYNGCPLLTYELYDAFITTFIRAELFDFNARLYSSKTTSASRSRLCHQLNLPYTASVGNRTPLPNNLTTEEQYPFNASESVENLIMDILTPAAIREAARRGRGVTSKIQPKRIIPVAAPALEVSMNPMEDSVLKSVPEPMSAKSYNTDRYRNPFFFETAFTGVNSPVTRVVSETELKSTFCTLPRKGATVQVGPMSTPPRYVYENPSLELSASDMIYHPKYSRILKSTDMVNASPTPNYSFYNYSNQSDSFGSSDASFHRSLPQRSHSSANLSDAYRDRSPYVPGVGRIVGRNPQGLMTPEGKRMAVASFRLLTLLLPPSRRKHLQILLRFMSKVAKNEKLMLDVAMTSRALIINVFFKIILNSADVSEFDELLALRIVTFMVDNDADIFAISEESELVQQVEEIISEEQITKVPIKEEITPPALQPQCFTNTSSSSIKQMKSRSKSRIKRLSSENKENKNVKLTYCYPISVDDYEGQKLLGSGGTSQSLRVLLDGIVTDPKIDHEFRRRKLLEFKKEYPHIYREKYGNSEPELLLLNESLKEEKPKERRAFSALLKPFRKT
ncbi:unnamed protein product [Orchesella dallaii]|uniref:DEP domain-containing protein n=1 Tax=Orchesella dallaii TaxID=48710 RepID=A0ABP1Q4F3_9HEXA